MTANLFYTGPSLGTLHEEYAKKSRIDEQAPLTSEASITIGAPVPAVWAVLSDVARWPAWYPRFTVLELGDVRPDAPMRWKLGGLTMRSTFAVVSPGRELTWSGRFLGYEAVDQHFLEPAGKWRHHRHDEGVAGQPPVRPPLPSQPAPGRPPAVTHRPENRPRTLTTIMADVTFPADRSFSQTASSWPIASGSAR